MRFIQFFADPTTHKSELFKKVWGISLPAYLLAVVHSIVDVAALSCYNEVILVVQIHLKNNNVARHLL